MFEINVKNLMEQEEEEEHQLGFGVLIIQGQHHYFY